MQTKLNNIYDYCKKWGLKINRDKTKVVIFAKHDPKIPIVFTCGDIFIETVNSYKYLGIVLHKSGELAHAQEHLGKQANKATHMLFRAVYGKNIQVSTMTTLFDRLVNPVMTYGAEVWLPFNIKIDKLVENDSVDFF